MKSVMKNSFRLLAPSERCEMWKAESDFFPRSATITVVFIIFAQEFGKCSSNSVFIFPFDIFNKRLTFPFVAAQRESERLLCVCSKWSRQSQSTKLSRYASNPTFAGRMSIDWNAPRLERLNRNEIFLRSIAVNNWNHLESSFFSISLLLLFFASSSRAIIFEAIDWNLISHGIHANQ